MYKRFTMQENLVIVESPAKAKTIEKFLGKDFMVKSSFGHIRDLSKKDLGINLADGFAPVYEIPKDKRKVVDELTRAAKDRTVWLASDEDREGEAIAWHLTEVLGLPVEGECVGKIEKGLLVLLGVGPQDTEKQADFLAEKCANLRIFVDENDKMNLSLLDIGGEMLVVSQFTLYADCRKGRRPSFVNAAAPAEADRLYEYFQQSVKNAGVAKVEHGKFGASMQVELLNNGPVTIMLDTDEIMPKK